MNGLKRQNSTYKVTWQRNRRREFAKINGFSEQANYRVGGIRKLILERDGYKCVKCDMTDEKHKKTWNRPITIDHKDKDRKNNFPSNLQTLCLSCHGRKDLLPRLRKKKFLPFLNAAIRMRKNGAFYEEIADFFQVSIATTRKYLNTVKKET